MKLLPERLRGYQKWLQEKWKILVMVDRDDDDCLALKKYLEEAASAAHLTTRATSPNFQVVNRIVVEELESWFFGDWSAVRTAYPRVPATIPQQAKYRNPDAITGGTWEALERVLQRAGYFRGGLRKMEFARTVAQYMQPGSNRSTSFSQFRQAVEGLAK